MAVRYDKIKMSSNICPQCKQDMRSKPHKGIKNKDCILCGQGLQWRKAAKQKMM